MLHKKEIQKELYTRFENLSFPFYDNVPLNAALPYGKFGYSHAIDDGTKTSDGSNNRIYIDLFSNYSGHLEIYNLEEAITNAVFNTPFVFDDFKVVSVKLEGAETLDEDDGTKHSILIFNFKLK